MHRLIFFREDAHTHYFGCHGRADAPWHRNFADRDPSVPVHTFDHDAASTFTVFSGTAIPEAFFRPPCLCIITSVNIFFDALLRHVGPVISFTIVFSNNVLDVVVNFGDRICDLHFPS